MEFEIAELPLHHQDAAADLGILQRDVGQRLDVEAGRHLDDLRRHVGARQAAAHPARHVAQGLRLHLVDENEGAQFGHGHFLNA